MSAIAVCGLVNMETTASVENFPIEYRPIDYRFFGVSTYPAGVGFNVASALNTLGDEVRLLSLTGRDSAAEVIRAELEAKGISTEFILPISKGTAQSVVLYDQSGRRYVICDLTDNQELSYDEDVFRSAVKDADIICMCNVNYSAGMLKVARETDALIATDVHCLGDIYDEYNARFMREADILFLSNEAIKGREEEFSLKLMEEYSNSVIVVGMGEKGALLRTKENPEAKLIPAVSTRKVINTVGAGDSLFSAFGHFYAKSRDAESSLKKATYFASWKIGEKGAAKGFLCEEELEKLMK